MKALAIIIAVIIFLLVSNFARVIINACEDMLRQSSETNPKILKTMKMLKLTFWLVIGCCLFYGFVFVAYVMTHHRG